MNKSNERKSGIAGELRYLAVCILIGIAFSYFLKATMDAKTLMRNIDFVIMWFLTLFLTGLFICFAMAGQMVLHEAGHLVFGLLSGYRFLSFRIDMTLWIQENGRIQKKGIGIEKSFSQCRMIPPDEKDGDLPVVLYKMGGSLMNLICTALSFGFCFLFRETGFLAVLFLIVGVTGFGTALFCGVPMRIGTVENDGYQVMSLLKSPAARHSFWVQMKADEMKAKGVRVGELPEEWFVFPDEKEMKNSMTAVLAVIYADRLIDRHMFREAAEWIDGMYAKDIAGVQKGFLTCDRLYCELLLDCDAEVIERLRTKEQMKFIGRMREKLSVIRTEYAYSLLLEKSVQKALRQKALFLAGTIRYPYPAEEASVKELMQIAESRAQLD